MSICKLVFLGDFCATHPELIQLDGELTNIISSADIRCLNFEGPMKTDTLDIPSSTILSQSEYSPQWCEDNGFNCISIANNHALDYGPEGLTRTIKSFTHSKIVGCGDWTEAYAPVFFEVNNYKIGILSASSADLASLKDITIDKDKVGCAWLNSDSFNNSIIQTKKQCDFLCIVPHAGVEYMNLPLPEWRDRYKSMIDLGADAIIASHPHVPQGFEWYNGKPILYSLGNFFFERSGSDNLPAFWNSGLIAVLEIGRDSTISFNVLPIKVIGYNIEMDHSQEVFKHLNWLQHLLTFNDIYINQVNAEVLKLYPKYEEWLLTSLKAVKFDDNKSLLRTLYRAFRMYFKYQVNHRVAMHQLREESTRYLLIRAFKLLSKSYL